MNDAKYIGLDVHQATISAAILDSTGKLVMESVLSESGNAEALHWPWKRGLVRRGYTSCSNHTSRKMLVY